MTRKPRRLHSVPTGDDVDGGRPDHHAAPTEPSAVPGWPFPLADLSSLTPTDVETLMDRIGEFSRDGQRHFDPARLPTVDLGPVLATRRRGRPAVAVTLRVRVDIAGIDPPIWRRLDLASDLGLDRLHLILQTAFGWLDMHLHSFVSGESPDDPAPERYLTPFDVTEGDEGIAESAVELAEVLADPGDKLFYTYDFGDNWEHVLVVEVVADRSVDDPEARCVAGERAGPPEDCGGVWGYQDLLDAGRLHGNPDAVDLAAINEQLARLPLGGGFELNRPVPENLPPAVADLLARTSGPAATALPDLLDRIDLTAPISVPAAAAEILTARHVWLLKRVGADGLAVTGAGYLKPVDVSAALAALFPAGEWPGAGNRESHALPVRWLRVSAQKFGLLRKSGGRLLLTKAGASLVNDPSALLERIAGRLPLGTRQHELDAGNALLLVMAAGGAHGGRSIEEQVADVMSGVGWRDERGRPISAHMARQAARPTDAVLRHLCPTPMSTIGRTVSAELAEFARLALIRGGS